MVKQDDPKSITFTSHLKHMCKAVRMGPGHQTVCDGQSLPFPKHFVHHNKNILCKRNQVTISSSGVGLSASALSGTIQSCGHTGMAPGVGFDEDVLGFQIRVNQPQRMKKSQTRQNLQMF